jgi:hypothetical protein
MVLLTLSCHGDSYRMMDKLADSKAVMEEAYMFISERHNPKRHYVPEAAGK